MKNLFRNEVLKSELYSVEHFSGIKLNQNECPWDLPIELKVKITERLLRTDWNRYPVHEMQNLQKKIADLNHIEANQVVLSNGSNTLIQALINITIPQNKILILDPCFVVYEHQANLHGNKVIKVPLSEDMELQTERTLTAIKKEKPGLIFIANPNSPTGSLFDKRSLYRIIQMANCPVVIDEAYYLFTEETVMDWLEDFNNLAILRTFSKATAIAAARCGYLISHKDIAEQVEKFLMPYRLSPLTCIIVDEILNNPNYIHDYVSTILKERARLFTKLQKIESVQVFPSEANFLLFRAKNHAGLKGHFAAKKVLIRDVSSQEALKDCFRVSVGTVEENDTFLEALKSYET